jgi:hypothetical protein
MCVLIIEFKLVSAITSNFCEVNSTFFGKKVVLAPKIYIYIYRYIYLSTLVDLQGISFNSPGAFVYQIELSTPIKVLMF